MYFSQCDHFLPFAIVIKQEKADCLHLRIAFFPHRCLGEYHMLLSSNVTSGISLWSVQRIGLKGNGNDSKGPVKSNHKNSKILSLYIFLLWGMTHCNREFGEINSVNSFYNFCIRLHKDHFQ